MAWAGLVSGPKILKTVGKPISLRTGPTYFMSYPWPGNIRELENVIERACFIAQDDTIGLDALPQNIVHYQKKASTARPVATQVAEGIALNNQMTVAETEKALIINHLVKEHGNIKRTSESLGMCLSPYMTILIGFSSNSLT